MGAAFLITLREGLEIALVLAILLGYLVKTDRQDRVGAVALGAGIAALLCIVAGVIVHLATSGLHGKAEPAVEGTLAIVAAIVLTWMILWMRKNARAMGGELRAKIDGASSVGAVAFIAFVAVAREGFETVLFLLGADAGNANGGQVVIGGLLGLAVSALVGVLIYRYGTHVDLGKFFRYTGVLLIFVAAGLVGKAAHEFSELFEFSNVWLMAPAWTIASGPLATGWVHDFLAGLFGWSSEPERVRVLAYFAYLVPTLYIFLKPTSTPHTAPEATTTTDLESAAGIPSQQGAISR
jgi:high-affinity iron transporter